MQLRTNRKRSSKALEQFNNTKCKRTNVDNNTKTMSIINFCDEQITN